MMRRWFVILILIACGWRSASAGEKPSPEIFSGPEAVYEPTPTTPSPQESEVMRWVWVQERMQIARVDAPVRVPVFFSAGECRDPTELVLIRWPSGQPVPVQADDVRRGPDGGVARLHLWFKTDLAAGETQRWALKKRESAADLKASMVSAAIIKNKLAVETSDTKASFNLDLARGGALFSLELKNGPSLEFPEGAGPATELRAGSGGDDEITPRSGGSLDWGSGPIFAKVVVRIPSKRGANAVEQVFRFFGDGSVNVIQSIRPAYATDRLTVKTQEFLAGRLSDARDLSVHPQSAGIVESLLEVHRGYVVDGLWSAAQPRGWLVIPGALGGKAGRVELASRREFLIHAPGAMTSGEGDSRVGTVRAFWAEFTLYPAARENQELSRKILLTVSQPLVGVVDRPNVDVAAATKRIEDNVREMKPVGWPNETAVRLLKGRPDPFPKRNWTVEAAPEHWAEAARKARAKVTGGSDRRLAEHEKGRAAGSLDPYHITYGTAALAYWLMQDDMPAPARASLRAQLAAVRQQLARTNEQGWPYLDVFARTQNMQMGPPLLALADSGADAETRRFYRDQLAAPHIAGVMLRGLRPYEGRPQNEPMPSDELYQGVVDFYLRATEIALNESLGLQPVAFGRYLDAIDVTADLYHPMHARAAEQAHGFARANLFRMQSHLHRWLNWGPAPFIALLQAPVGEERMVPGATEVWYYANELAGHWKNWPDQSWLFLAAKLPALVATRSPSARPPPLLNARVRREGSGNHIDWDKQPEAAAYRVYRLRSKQPPLWLNSPYGPGATTNPAALEWSDEDGRTDDRYRIHVVDAAGRESGW